MNQQTSLIRTLSEQTINVIAAGEVIENPAAVVKELVENAIDAGATHVTIEVEEGGLKLMRISDNGSGMSPDDALLSLERHATSKIREAADLEQLLTMGFRGEALASIAAISKMTLLTSLEAGKGTKIEGAGGKILSVASCARSRGTTLEVRCLFYNVPARRKFQKSSRGSQAEISKMVTSLSLGYPDIALDLFYEGKLFFSLPALGTNHTFSEQLILRAKKVLTDNSPLIPISVKEENFHLEGFFSYPEMSRSIRYGQYLFLNRRSISAFALAAAVKEGYGTLIAEKQYPPFLLHLFLPPSHFDVNVHPQKKEVRFLEERELKAKIILAVRSGLQKSEEKQEEPRFTPSHTVAFENWEEPEAPNLQQTVGFSFREARESFPPPPSYTPLIRQIEETPLPELLIPQNQLYVFGLFSHFLLAEKTGKFLVIDLLSCRARLLFSSLSSREKVRETQTLMIPLTVELSTEEAERLLFHEKLLEEMGFALQSLGKGVLLISSIPADLDLKEISVALEQLSHDLFELSEEGIEPKKERHLARICSQIARRGKKEFSKDEALALWEKLQRGEQSLFCPLGKPIFITMDAHEIASLFSSKKS